MDITDCIHNVCMYDIPETLADYACSVYTKNIPFCSIMTKSVMNYSTLYIPALLASDTSHCPEIVHQALVHKTNQQYS